MTTSEIQDEIIEDFTLFEDDFEGKLMYLMDLGKKIPAMPAEHQTEDYIVKGCQSKVWLFPVFEDGKIYFEADSNTEITKGLVSLLVRIWSGKSAEEIMATELYFIEKIGMSRMIGSQRSNGFSSMIKQMKMYAFAKLNSQN